MNVVGHTAAAQEDLGNLAVGFIDGVDANGGRIFVFQRLEAISGAQIQVSKIGLTNPCCNKNSSLDRSAPEYSAMQISFSKISIPEIRPAQVR